MQFEEEISVRAARAEDSDFLFATTKAALGAYIEQMYGPWNEADQQERFANRARAELDEIVELNGEPVGYVSVEWLPDHAYVWRFCLSPATQRCGVGSYLLRAVISKAQARQLPVRLHVFKVNPAKGFWSRHGFVVTGETATHFEMERSTNPSEAQLIAALSASDASTRLEAALAIGSKPWPGLVDELVARCAVEPDFYVRDMLTWALTRFPSTLTLPRLLAELRSDCAQARSQSLHTLSKIRDADAWPAITRSLLRDSDDEVARSAWRAAVVHVPDGKEKHLAEELATQLGRGNREIQLSLSRALVALGAEAIEPVLERAKALDKPDIRAHACATERLLRDPNAGFELAVDQAKRIFVLGK